jgi:uncharacterized phage infection (PIP) family protein YhgE
MARRALGWAALAYAIAGFALIAVGAIGGLDMAGRIESLALRADSTLAAAQRATQATAESFSGVDSSLANGQQSAEEAATLARDASATLESLSVAMSLTLFGAQPLQPLAEDFATSADQATALADTLDGVGDSLGATRQDMTRIGGEMDDLATELGELRVSADPGGSAPPIRLFVVLVLAWLGLQAVAALAAGLTLLRRSRRRLLAEEEE